MQFDPTDDVCAQSGAHESETGFAWTKDNLPDPGIYCSTSSITLSGNNLTVDVTLVAPDITLSGSNITLTPFYEGLAVLDTALPSGRPLSILGNDANITGILDTPSNDVLTGRLQRRDDWAHRGAKHHHQWR